ncbi:MAG: hypothetical protein QOG45_2884 [Chloroflexota bacterium]|nr:hypothetical protein [Chloroflexota bacterium]
MARLPDDVVDAILAEPVTTQDPIRSVGRITGPHEALVPITTFDVFGWRDLLYLANGVRHRRGIGKDDSGFRYPGDELDPGEEPFEDVDVYNPIGEVFVSMPAFERLAARYFRALVDGAARIHDPVTRQPWWPEFVAATEEIEGRVSSG